MMPFPTVAAENVLASHSSGKPESWFHAASGGGGECRGRGSMLLAVALVI